MLAKLIAGASVIALTAVAQSNESVLAEEAAHPVVVRLSVPLPAGDEHGFVSFSSSLGRTHLRFAVIWSGDRKKPPRGDAAASCEPKESGEALLLLALERRDVPVVVE
jgi:hypothetical protein